MSLYKKKSKELNNNSGQDFWKCFKRTFYKVQPNVIGDLKSQDCVIHTDKQKAQTFYEDIFLGKHMNLMGCQSDWETEVKRKIQYTEDTSHNFPHLSSKIKVEELLEAIKSIKVSGKGPDYDAIHPMMIKIGGAQFHITLLILYNAVLQSTIWPFSNNVVIFLKKLGRKDYTSTSNYRPITITSISGKVLEQILETRLRKLTEKKGWIPNHQHGFRKKQVNINLSNTSSNRNSATKSF